MNYDKPGERYERIMAVRNEFEGYRNNREIFRRNLDEKDTPGANIREVLHEAAEIGLTYKDIGITREEMKEFFGGYLKDIFDQNEPKV